MNFLLFRHFYRYLIVLKVVIWLQLSTEAVPLQPPSISVPIRRFSPREKTLNGVHPAVIHQQSMNRGMRRLATMTGRTPPKPHELYTNLFNRISYLAESNSQCAVGCETHTSDPGHGAYVGRPGAPNSTTGSTIPLTIEGSDIGYIGVVRIGTPPREFNLLIDSGSADTWVGSETCRGDDGGGCGQHNFLGPSTSSSFEMLEDEWSIVYGSGAVSGHLARDEVSIANFTLRNFTLGVAFNESADFTPDEIVFDGLLGLAKSIISRQRTPTLVEALRKANLIRKNIISYKIPRLRDGRNDGEMTLGAMNPRKYIAKTLVTVKNRNPFGFWEVPLDRVMVAGRGMGWENRTAVLDTGTTLILAPEGDVDAIHGAIHGAKKDNSGSWTVPCTLNSSLTLGIGGGMFDIHPRDLAFLPVDPADPTGDCISGIGVGYVGPFNLATGWLVGDVFLKNVYFSTDEDRDEISIAKTAS